MTRLTTSAGARQANYDLQRAMRTMNDLQRQLTSGRRLERVSDAPADAVSSLAQRAELRRVEQYGRNAERATSWVRSADAALSSVDDQLTAVRSLLVQANSGAADATARAGIATQIRAIRTALLDTANTQVEGRPIFAGTVAGAKAYDSSATYVGDAGAVDIPVSPNVSMQVNVSGTTVFGTANLLDPTQGDVFQVLESIATSVQSGDTTAMGAGLGLIDTAAQRVAQSQVVLGARGAQLESLELANVDASTNLKAGISRLEDVDLAEALIGLRTREAAYQAALQATAKVVQPSLLDFLR